MTTSATLESTSMRLDPGSEAVVPVQIRNNSQVVEGYDLTVIGPPAAWATVEPTTFSLYPGTATTATITFRPPRSARTPVGEQPFGVRILPTEHPEDAVVPEGLVEVLPFLETTAELIPRTSQGRTGRHKLAIDNRGNVPVNVLVDATSDGDRVRFKVDPVGLAIDPGQARFVSVTVKARRRIWRGQPVTHAFVIGVAPRDGTPITLDGSHVQTPVVPKWLVWLVLGLLVLTGAALAAWFQVLKPTVESQAKESVAEVAEDAQEAAEDAGAAAEQADDSAGKAKESEENIDKKFPKTEPEDRVSDVSRRLAVTTAGTGTATYALPKAKDTYELTDVVFGNPQGDFGQVQLLVDGAVQLEHNLENFRDLDFHFVSPILVDDEVTLQAQCRTPGQPPDAPPPETCSVSVLLGGKLVRPEENSDAASQAAQ